MANAQKGSLWLFSIGVFMAALDNGIITASLTTLIDAFGVSTSWGAWTITIYTLGLALSVPIVGKLSDQFGRKKLFLIEISLFAIGSFLVAISFNFPVFLLSRFIQSMGGGGIFIIASSYILHSFPKDRQGRALGILGGMNGIAAILGPNVGAFILHTTGSWHWLFLINIPIAILLFIFGWKYLKEEQELVKEKLDWQGIIFISIATLSIMYSLTIIGRSPYFWLYLLIGILALFMLSKVEKRVDKPLLPLSLMKVASYRLTIVVATFSGMILASVIFIPGYIENNLGVSRELAGFWFTPLALASGVGAGLGGRLVDKKDPIFSLTVASIISAIGYLLFVLWVSSLWQMVIASCFVGAGFGMMLGAPINVLATEKTEQDKGVALGTVSLFRQLGMTIGPTLYAGFMFLSPGNQGYSGLFWAALAISIMALIVTRWIKLKR